MERMKDRVNSVPAVVALRKNNVLFERKFDRLQQVLVNRPIAISLLLCFRVISLRRKLIMF